MRACAAVVKIFLAVLLLDSTFGAPNVMFDNSETDSTGIGQGDEPAFKFGDSESSVAVTESQATSIAGEASGLKDDAAFFPAETVSESAGEPKAPEGIVPAPIGGETEGRTFHHLAQLHNKVDRTVHSFLYKLLSPWFAYSGEPHHFSQGPYYEYDNEGIYRKDVVSQPTSAISKVLSPLVKAPKFFINHPINFKQGFAHLQHAIGKRSVDAEGSQLSENYRQGKTLDKIVPNFEHNVGVFMRRIFGDLYGSNSNHNFGNAAYKSGIQINRNPESQHFQPQLAITNLMGHYLRRIPDFVKQIMPQLLRQ